ncbi:hypothetical protein [Candidatus Phycosocius spiralis]|uniref:Uncharacterized protein n=1 Tax=Candidatus Phycosocius spiralis TaxID=2815099 RepID=A0ABQ4PVI4_9PROT|nr:hypothetical protein [Candidatus Phycosocius spiralis]GIU67037.1 hypothetical protein PsB1_1191 [Candidatus Phycosocius spiralis]
MQLSLLSALDAALLPPKHSPQLDISSNAMTIARAHNSPTMAQIAYLKKITRITAMRRLRRYVARKVGKSGEIGQALALTKQDFARAIDLELKEKRWMT